jgi:hypothetical protein
MQGKRPIPNDTSSTTHLPCKRKAAENLRELPEPARARVPATFDIGPTSSHVGIGHSISDVHVAVLAAVISLVLFAEVSSHHQCLRYSRY